MSNLWLIISTWRMGKEGVLEASKLLEENGDSGDAVEIAIKEVENFEYYKSVGYGGLPNEDMEVELDAAYMDGNTLDFGAVAAIHNFANPISIAKSLSKEKLNNVLVSKGAEKYARENGFEQKNMLSERAMIHYKNRQFENNKQLKAYDGHDTVGMVCIDKRKKIVSATSTSGLFMKKSGRVGDSPIIGSGFYADSQIGGATATGLGEDIMKGCLSYEIVSLMRQGYNPQQACDIAITELEKNLFLKGKKLGDCSVVAINKKGEWGASSNTNSFSFVVASNYCAPTVYLCKKKNGCTVHVEASSTWLDEYMNSRMKEIKLKENEND